MSLPIASIEPATPAASSTRRSSASSLTFAAAHDTSALVARLERCNRSHCLSLAAATRYTASAALGTGRYLASQLFEVKPTDPATYAAVAGVLLATGLVACAIPAFRAMRVDPLVALRNE